MYFVCFVLSHMNIYQKQILQKLHHNLGILTNSELNRLNALLHHSVHSNTAAFLSMVLKQVVMSAKNGINFL